MTRDVSGSFRVQMPTTIASGGLATINCLTSSSVDIQLMQPGSTITLTNLNQVGQSIRVVLRPDSGVVPTSVVFAGPTIIWPNNISPNLFVGTNKIAIVTLIVIGDGKVLATYVTY
jgi:hypothetical protein